MKQSPFFTGSPLSLCSVSLLALALGQMPDVRAQGATAPEAPLGNTPAVNAPTGNAQTGNAPAVNTPATTTPPANTPAIAYDINVLILALDDADIKSAHPANLTESRPPRALPGATGMGAPLSPLAPQQSAPGGNAAGGNAANAPAPGGNAPAIAPDGDELQLPPAPARSRVPAGDLKVEELPPIAPASYPNQGQSNVAWRALAQRLGSIPDLPGVGGNFNVEAPNRRSPGRAQIAAAPLRRALSSMGVRDVLATPLDGPTIVRTVNSGRLDLRVVDRLRYSTDQMLQNPSAQGDDITPELAQARSTAIRMAARVGLSMGYRAVVVVAVSLRGEYSLLLVDATQETGEAFAVAPSGTTLSDSDQNASATAASLIASRLSQWAPFTPDDRTAKIEGHMTAAREALAKNDNETAQDHLMQAVALDASHAEAYILLGDTLQKKDPVAAASAYQRAAEINTRNGEVWARIAITHTLSTPPDWVLALQSAARAQSLDYDSANLRTAMAAAEFGRADLFRRNGRPDQAEDAEAVARRHIERAREMAPDDPEVVAGVSRLMAKYLLEQKRYREAVQSLDLLAVQYPNDLQTQLMYAQALEGYGKREEDLFTAWARVWRLGGDSDVAIDAKRYTRITDGFDQRLFSLAKNVFQMTSGVATGALPRETALLQAERSRNDLKATVAALQLMRPPGTRAVSDAHNGRLFASDLMQQAVELYILYLETSDDINRSRAVDIHRQAIESLNAARLIAQ